MVLLVAAWFMPACFAADAAAANAALSQAEHDLDSAYVAVAEAETAGATVSALLLSKLNGAGESLSQAHAALKTGDYANANALAVECSRALEGVTMDAASLKADAEREHDEKLFLTVAVSSIGLSVLLVVGLLSWTLLKKWCLKRFLGFQP